MKTQHLNKINDDSYRQTNTVIKNLKKQLTAKYERYAYLSYRKAIIDVADTIFKYDTKSAIDLNNLPDVVSHRIVAN